MKALNILLVMTLAGSCPTRFYGGVLQLPQGATVYEQRTLVLPGSSSPVRVTIYQDEQTSISGVLVEQDGRQLARATQNAIRLYEGTGIYDVTGEGAPNIVLVGVEGAKSIAAIIYSYRDNRLSIIGQWSGWQFKVAHINNKPVVALTPAEYGLLTDLYVWHGTAFHRCNECFPEFYGPEIEAQWKALDQSSVPAYVFSQAGRLGATALVYGRQYAEAVRLCNKARQAVNTTSRLIPSRIGGSVNVVQQDQSAAEIQINVALAAIEDAKQRNTAVLDLK